MFLAKKSINYSLVFILKIGASCAPFILYGLMARQYSQHQFGYFQYIMSFLMLSALLEAGVVSSFKNTVIRFGDRIKLEFQRAFAFSVMIIALLFPFIYFFVFRFSSSNIVACSVVIVTFSLLGAVFTTYYDLMGRHLFIRAIDVLVYIVSICVAIYICYRGGDIRWVFFVLCLGKGLWFLVPFILNVKFLLGDFFFTEKFRELCLLKGEYLSENFRFFSLQSLYTTYSLFSSYILSHSLGMSFFGVFSLYQKFFLVPAMLYGILAPILWIKFGRETTLFSHISYVKIVSFISFILLLFVLFSFFLFFFVPVYAGEKYAINISILFLLGCSCGLFMVRDILSTYLIAKQKYDRQIICMMIFNIVLIYFYYAFSSVEIYLIGQIVVSIFILVSYLRVLVDTEALGGNAI